MTARRGLVLGSIGVALLLGLTGCIAGTGGPEPSDSPMSAPPASSPPASPSASPDPAPARLVIPTCDDLLPLSQAQSIFSHDTEFIGESVPSSHESVFGIPAVQHTLASATSAKACTWGVPNSDGGFNGIVATISETDRTALEAALSASGFSSVEMGTVHGYDQSSSGDLADFAETHLFTGEVWIFTGSGDLTTTGQVAGALLDAMRTANPSHGL